MDKGYYSPRTKDELAYIASQSTIKMDKGYYSKTRQLGNNKLRMVAIHNKNGQGLLQKILETIVIFLNTVAIHNKNGQGLLQN